MGEARPRLWTHKGGTDAPAPAMLGCPVARLPGKGDPMDARRFDALTKTLARRLSRRAALSAGWPA